MQYERDRAWLEVNLDAIRHNYDSIKKKIGTDCDIITVLKANAYGLGAPAIAAKLEDAGCPMFAVVCFEEAIEIREYGVKAPVLVMGPVNPVHASVAAESNIELAVVDLKQATELSDAALAAGKRVRVHIKVDTGLHRLGIVATNRIEEAIDEIRQICALGGLEPVAVFTHFTATEMPGAEEFNSRQMRLFATVVARLDAIGIKLKKHCSSSIPAVLYPEYNYDYIRVAALVFGLRKDTYRDFDIKETVDLKTRICQLKEVPQGSPISYGPLFHTLRDSKLAVLPIGFADGLRRSIANRGSALLHGKKAPIIGKLSSDYTIIDVTDIPDARVGDTVTMFGTDNGIEQPMYTFADLYPGTPAEVSAVIGPRIPRFYINGGVMTRG